MYVTAITGEIKESSHRKTYRESEPDPKKTETCLETKQIRSRDRYKIVADKSHEHNRLHILNTLKDIGKAQLKPVPELIGKQNENKRNRHRRHFRRIREHTGSLISESIQQYRKHDRYRQHHPIATPYIRANSGNILTSIGIAYKYGNGKGQSEQQQEEQLRYGHHHLVRGQLLDTEPPCHHSGKSERGRLQPGLNRYRVPHIEYMPHLHP